MLFFFFFVSPIVDDTGDASDANILLFIFLFFILFVFKEVLLPLVDALELRLHIRLSFSS